MAPPTPTMLPFPLLTTGAPPLLWLYLVPLTTAPPPLMSKVAVAYVVVAAALGGGVPLPFSSRPF